MIALALETSTQVASVALLDAAGQIHERIIGSAQRQNEALLPEIEALLQQQRVPRHALEAVVIGGGPGSFTGLRIAAATAKGLCHALGRPLYAYSGLLAAAFEYRDRTRDICALFDARRDQVYAATYRFAAGIEAVRAPEVASIAAVIAAQRDRPLFVGDGAQKHRARIEAGGFEVAAEAVLPRAGALLELLRAAEPLGRIADRAHWEPNYVRASGAERGVQG